MPCNKCHPSSPLIATVKAIALQSIWTRSVVKWMSLDASVLRFFALGLALRPARSLDAAGEPLFPPPQSPAPERVHGQVKSTGLTEAMAKAL